MSNEDVSVIRTQKSLSTDFAFLLLVRRGKRTADIVGSCSEPRAQLVHARARRRFQRGLKKRPMGLIKKLRKAKKAAPPNEKPAVVKTHLRDMIIVPEMIGSVVGIYNGKVFNSVEIKPEMTGHYLAEFSCSYKPVKHGRPGVSVFATLSLRGGLTYTLI